MEEVGLNPPRRPVGDKRAYQRSGLTASSSGVNGMRTYLMSTERQKWSAADQGRSFNTVRVYRVRKRSIDRSVAHLPLCSKHPVHTFLPDRVT